MSMKKYHGRKTLVLCVVLLFITGLLIPTIHSQLSKQQKYQYSISPQESNTIIFKDSSRYIYYLIAQTSNKEFFSSHMQKFFAAATSVARLLTSMEDNHPPEPPTITGPTQGQVGILYLWTLMSNDPENDNVTYYVDWGDRCGAPLLYGPYLSGQEVEVSHTYHSKSTFIINARAIDMYGAESTTTYFEVLMPKNTFLSVPFFLRLLERYPYAFPMLRSFFK